MARASGPSKLALMGRTTAVCAPASTCQDDQRVGELPAEMLGPLGGFGLGQPCSLSTLYQSPNGSTATRRKKRKSSSRISGSLTGSVTTKRELGLRVTDFFDYTTEDSTAGGVPQFVTNYYWDAGQNLFENSTAPGGQEDTFCRVRRVQVWVLPTCRTFDKTGEAGSNNANSAFTVNCQVPAMGQSYNAVSPLVARAYATDTQVTNVLPRIDTKWKKVFTCDLQKTFQSGVVRPVFIPSLPTNQCIFQMSIVNQTDGLPFLVGDDQPPIRVKVQLDIDQPIATVQEASLAVWRNEEFALPYTEQNGAAYPGTSSQYVQMDLSGSLDNFR